MGAVLGTESSVENDVGPVNTNPNYAYAYNVADEKEQLYQSHVQEMEDKVQQLVHFFKN